MSSDTKWALLYMGVLIGGFTAGFGIPTALLALRTWWDERKQR